MFELITSLFMSSTAYAAFETAIYSAGLASGSGMYQAKEPDELQAIAEEHMTSHRHSRA